MCLLDFLPSVQDTIAEQTETFLKRKQLIEQLIIQIGSPMEYDTVTYKKISFYIDDSATPYLIHISIPGIYPKDKPTCAFQSLNILTNRSVPIQKTVSQIPWSPRWQADEFVKKLKPHLAEVGIEFKKTLVDDII